MTAQSPEIDDQTGAAYSNEFLEARARAIEAARRYSELRLHGGDPDVIAKAQQAMHVAQDDAFALVQRDRDRHTREAMTLAARKREEELIRAPMDQSVSRAVALLLHEGPLSGVEIEARRLPGLSHNVVRPVLREAMARGLVNRIQIGRRVKWAAAQAPQPAA